jgi:hypothetical protein
MRKLLGLLLALALAVPVWPRAQPKPAPSSTAQGTAPATTSSPCIADYYRNSDGVCVHRPVKTQGSSSRTRVHQWAISSICVISLLPSCCMSKSGPNVPGVATLLGLSTSMKRPPEEGVVVRKCFAGDL